jgi:hypothetical protein
MNSLEVVLQDIGGVTTTAPLSNRPGVFLSGTGVIIGVSNYNPENDNLFKII